MPPYSAKGGAGLRRQELNAPGAAGETRQLGAATPLAVCPPESK